MDDFPPPTGTIFGVPVEPFSNQPIPYFGGVSNSIPPDDFLDDSSDTLGPTSHYTTTPHDVPQSSSSEGHNPPKQTKRRGRKGHTKSRKGCFNCKKARIKCKENRPSCDYCAHRGLICEWPDMQISQLGTLIRNPVAPVSSSTSSSVPMPLQSDVPVFNMQDFKLFYHFIESAYPHHPIGDDSVWKHEIPSIASNHDYLLHGMLALAASELAEEYPESSQLSCTAMSHRVKTIGALNAAISSGMTNFEQGNAMLATCFTMIFQSVLIEDGLAEYLTFIRGTVVVGIQMGMKKMHILFNHLFGDRDLEKIDPKMRAASLIEPELVRVAIRSLEKVAPLCKTKLEIEVYSMLLSSARALVTSSRDGYMALRKFYTLFSYTMPHHEFQELINPANQICKLLLAHFLALQLTLTPVAKNEWAEKDVPKQKMTNNGVTARWFPALHRDIPEELMEYYEWPLWVESEVKENRVYNGVVKREVEEE